MRAFFSAMTLLGSAAVGAAAPPPDDCKINGLAIGCQAYTFRLYSAAEAIEKTAQAGGKVIEFFPGQKAFADDPVAKLDHNAPRDLWDKIKEKLAKHNIRAVNYGVVGVPKDEAKARKVFDFAKYMGLYAITTESDESIDTLEKLAKEYDIRVAFHNHPRQPKNPNYRVWDPNYIAALVKDRDPRVGACADTGHWLRTGLKPIECLRILKGRVISMHLKDLNEIGKPGAHDVVHGNGKCDVPAVFAELRAQKFVGNISIEYEHNWEKNVEDVTKCVAYLKTLTE